MKEQNMALIDLRKNVNITSAEKKAEDTLLELLVVMERESTACRELKELSLVQNDLKLDLEEKNVVRLSWSKKGLSPKRRWMSSEVIWNWL